MRLLINEETQYRTGRDLVKFFNELGFNDQYGEGFPSRWKYTDDRLEKINGTPKLETCIKNTFSPVNFIGRFDELDEYIEKFNQYLAFDDYKIIRDNKNIQIIKDKDIQIKDDSSKVDESEFLRKEFSEIDIDKLGLDGSVSEVLKTRLKEMEKCLSMDAPLAMIFLAGSTLEGILLGMALKNPKEFNQSSMAPKDKNNKVLKFHDWTLNNFIDVAYDLDLLLEDVRKFSHYLRGFRNYIHPYEQVSIGFNPDKHTASICWQVLKAAFHQLTKS